ncbi:MAG: YggT family protein [Nitrosopumilus sp.]|nr:YggT family protein [Nitrosopumilus sp.]
MEPVIVRSESKVKPLYRGTQIVWYILNLLEVLLAFRFVLRLMGANAGAGFTSFIYAVTYPFVAPFLNVFSISRVAGATFEWTTLLAMFVYWLIAWGIIRIITMNRPVSTTEADYKLSKQDTNP